MSYFHIANATLSSALFRFTAEFGMGSGGSKTLLSPSKFGVSSIQSNLLKFGILIIKSNQVIYFSYINFFACFTIT
jgi:hypothetical protein